MTNTIINWYLSNKRDLPWRNTQDPYLIWISEIILQQTRVSQGLDYYLRITGRFPTVNDLAAASEEEVLRLWQGLGYYSRARNMHAAAKEIVNFHQGIFPSDYKAILHLKGIGPYTAAAIASFAFQQPHAAVDGNVYRVIARLFGITSPIDTNEGKKLFHAIAGEMLDQKRPDLFNQAMMEFGAIQCTPRSPDCGKCPLQDQCFSFANKIVDQVPVKQGKTKVKPRFFHFFEIGTNDCLLIEQRQSDDIWKGLYQLPLIEKENDEPVLQSETEALLPILGVESITLCKEYKHILSHQHLYCRFYKLEVREIIYDEPYRLIKRDELDQYAIPRIIDKYFEEFR